MAVATASNSLCVPHLSPLLSLSHPVLVCPCHLRAVALGELPVAQRDPISIEQGQLEPTVQSVLW